MITKTDPLVSTEWLAANLGKPNVRIIDATFKMPGVLPLPKDDYLAAHIPGAVFFDVDAVSDHSNPLPHMFPSAEQFGRHAPVGALGAVFINDIEKGKFAFGIGAGFFGHGGLSSIRARLSNRRHPHGLGPPPAFR